MTPVEPYHNEPMRFLVRSESNPRDQFLVDLSAYDGNGWCGCDDFRIQDLARLERGFRDKNCIGILSCKHIDMALRYQHRELLKTAIAAIRKNRKANAEAGPRGSGLPQASEGVAL